MFSNRMLVFRAGIQIMLVRIADREDPDQTASGWVCFVCLGRFGRQLVFEIVEHKPYILGPLHQMVTGLLTLCLLGSSTGPRF